MDGLLLTEQSRDGQGALHPFLRYPILFGSAGIRVQEGMRTICYSGRPSLPAAL